MKIFDTTLSGVKLIDPHVFGDGRGFFLETWSERAYADAGLPFTFVQDNHSRSRRGVLRGMHYQIEHPQGKLVRVVNGAVYDVVVDMRRSSPTFGQWEGFYLTGENKRILWAPPGMAHGFLCLVNETDFLYKCTDVYAPEHERSLLWSEPTVAIEWPLDKIGEPIVNAKDQTAKRFEEADTYA